jgi:hypothetical protein
MASTSDYYAGIDVGYGTSASTYTTVKYERKNCGRCGFTEVVAEMHSFSYRCRVCGNSSAETDVYMRRMQEMMRPQQNFAREYMGMYPQPEPALKPTNSKLEPSSRVEDEQENKKEQKVMNYEDIIVGVKYKLNQRGIDSGCGAISGQPVDYIIVTSVAGETKQYLKYDSYDVHDNFLEKCSSCLTPLDLIPAKAGGNKTSMLQPLEALSNLIQRTFSEDTKTLYRAGYLSKDLNITQKLTDALGEMFVGHIIAGDIKTCTLESFATELITQAKKEVTDAEKAEKNS